VKVFFDTNVLVSAFTTRGLSADLMRLVIAQHELLTGEVNLAEFRRVLRDRFRVPPADISALERQLREHTVVARPAALSDIRVTGDKDLLAIAKAAPLPVLDPRGCWDRLRGRSA
jgi:predicted nucleic acid-binding protein